MVERGPKGSDEDIEEVYHVSLAIRRLQTQEGSRRASIPSVLQSDCTEDTAWKRHVNSSRETTIEDGLWSLF